MIDCDRRDPNGRHGAEMSSKTGSLSHFDGPPCIGNA